MLLCSVYARRCLTVLVVSGLACSAFLTAVPASTPAPASARAFHLQKKTPDRKVGERATAASIPG
jgi:hypothetical protein